MSKVYSKDCIRCQKIASPLLSPQPTRARESKLPSCRRSRALNTAWFCLCVSQTSDRRNPCSTECSPLSADYNKISCAQQAHPQRGTDALQASGHLVLQVMAYL